jgi:hypothetical protein
LIAGAERSSSTVPATAMTPTPNKISAISTSTGAILGVGDAARHVMPLAVNENAETWPSPTPVARDRVLLSILTSTGQCTTPDVPHRLI